MNRVPVPMTKVLLIAGLCCILVVCSTALSITTPSSQIVKGDNVSMNIMGLPDGATFTFRITGTFPVKPGGEFLFEADNFQMPFSLKASQIHASMHNTDLNTFAVKKGDIEIRKTGHSIGGSYNTSYTYNISSGTYDFMKISGNASPGASSVIAYLEMNGTKKGPENGVISFTLAGMDLGTVELNARVNGSTAFSKIVTVGSPDPLLNSSLGIIDSAADSPPGSSPGGTRDSSHNIDTNTPTSTNVTPSPVKAEMVNGIPMIAQPSIPIGMVTALPPGAKTIAPPIPTKTAMSFLPLLGLVIAVVFLVSRRKP